MCSQLCGWGKLQGLTKPRHLPVVQCRFGFGQDGKARGPGRFKGRLNPRSSHRQFQFFWSARALLLIPESVASKTQMWKNHKTLIKPKETTIVMSIMLLRVSGKPTSLWQSSCVKAMRSLAFLPLAQRIALR